MTRTLEVLYDGVVFRPETPLDLEPNKRYTISIEGELKAICGCRPSSSNRLTK